MEQETQALSQMLVEAMQREATVRVELITLQTKTMELEKQVTSLSAQVATINNNTAQA